MRLFNTPLILSVLLLGFTRAHLNENVFPLQNPIISTPSHRISTVKQFNITLNVGHYIPNVTFALESNEDLIAKDAHVQHLDIRGNIRHAEHIDPSMHRLFKGSVRMSFASEKVGWVRISMLKDGVDPLFEGAFTIANEQYEIRLQSNVSGHNDYTHNRMMVYRTSQTGLDGQSDNRSSSQSVCKSREMNLTKTPFALSERQLTLGDLTDSIGNTSGCPNSRRMAYIGVVTDCSYTAGFDSTSAVRQNILNMVNTASVVFENSFNISLGLRNLTISDAACPESTSDSTPWNAPCSTGDLNWRLNQLSTWRGSIGEDANAYWTLMTQCNSGSEVGVSWIGALCNSAPYGSYGYSSAVGANVVARTFNTEWQVFAHESAHTLGAVHDCSSDTCTSGSDATSQCCPLSSSTCDANGEFIMNPSAGAGITRFSPCTIGNVCSRLGSGTVSSRCLVDYSDTGNNGTMNSPGSCGNGIVEAGEDCDCGQDSCDERDTNCCDAMTCQWREGCGSQDDSDNSESSNDRISWVDRHRSLVIGLSAGIGGALLLLVVVLSLLYSCRSREKPI